MRASMLALTLLGLLAAPAGAQLYKWTDENGRLHVTDDLNQIPERYRSQVPSGSTSAGRPAPPTPDAESAWQRHLPEDPAIGLQPESGSGWAACPEGWRTGPLTLADLAKMTCDEYECALQYSRPMPKEYGRLPAREQCELIPKNCGPSGLWGNPAGQQSYYYRSRCYLHHAIVQLDEGICDQVKERSYPGLGGDGSYYSKKNCLKEIRQKKTDNAASVLEPRGVVTIAAVQLSRTASDRLVVTVKFRPDSTLTGKYAINLDVTVREGAIPPYGLGLHPEENEAIKRDLSYWRLYPSPWIVTMTPSMIQAGELRVPIHRSTWQHSFEYTTSRGQVVRGGFTDLQTALPKLIGARLEVRLSFLQDESGKLPKPTFPKGSFQSFHAITVTSVPAE